MFCGMGEVISMAVFGGIFNLVKRFAFAAALALVSAAVCAQPGAAETLNSESTNGASTSSNGAGSSLNGAGTSGQILVDVSKNFAGQIATIDDPDGRGAIAIMESGVTLDMGGGEVRSTKANPALMEGVGIYAKGLKNITIKNGIVAGYKWGIFLEDCENVTIENMYVLTSRTQKLVSTDEIYDTADWLNQWSVEGFEQYGGAVYLKGCTGGVVRGVHAEYQQNGVTLTRSRRITIENCRLSFNSGWGIHLWDADNNRIRNNEAEYCYRLETWKYSAGGDSAGILIGNDSNYNIVEDNSFAHGGDGIFLCGQRPWLKPSNYNMFRRNDCRFSPHNGIEATFSRGNRFEKNNVSGSRYGFWMGYSRESLVEGNIIENCIEDGIAIEHGNNNTITGNIIANCKVGIRIWNRPMPDWVGNDPSHDYTITWNTIKNVQTGIFIEDTQRALIENNFIAGTVSGIRVNESADVTVRHNDVSMFEKGGIAIINSDGYIEEENTIAK